jgi:predicted DNA-binding protein YlxM (UPF0122 family)
LYYLDDHSLGEIADEYEISRQAVYDNIRRTEAMLEEYEDKLQLFEKFQERQIVIEQLNLLLEDEDVQKPQILELINQLKEWD